MNSFRIIELPNEIMFQMILNLDLFSYFNLRNACKALRNRLDKEPILKYTMYRQAVKEYGQMIRTESLKMKLNLDELDDKSFEFLCNYGHSDDIIRCLDSCKFRKVSLISKQNALIAIIKTNGDPRIIAGLLTHSEIDPDIIIPKWKKLIFWACWKGHNDVINTLINDSKVDLNEPDTDGNYLIHIAALSGNFSILKMLIENKRVDPYVLGIWNQTVLHFAASKDIPEILKYILEHTNINVNVRDANGNHALHIAASFSCSKNIKALLNELGVDPNLQNNLGQTSLHLISAQGNFLSPSTELDVFKSVKTLLTHPNIDVSLCNNENLEAFHSACIWGIPSIVSLFLDDGRISTKSKFKAYEICHQSYIKHIIPRLLKEKDLIYFLREKHMNSMFANNLSS